MEGFLNLTYKAIFGGGFSLITGVTPVCHGCNTNLRMARSVFGGCAAPGSTGAKVGWTQDTVIGGMDSYQTKIKVSKQRDPNLKI